MRNPLNKRFVREVKAELGKYISIFFFITGMIGFLSGFLIAGDSMLKSAEGSYEMYQIEDGNFELFDVVSESLQDKLENEGVALYENYYIEEETRGIDSILRIFKNRNEINLVCVMEGEVPASSNEIAIDRVYAKNNKIAVGDTLQVDGKSLIVSGFVALSDYTTLYQNPSDMMFDTTKFGIGIMTDDGFEGMPQEHLHYSYSWKYDEAPLDDSDAKYKANDLLEVISANAMMKGYLPAYLNQAINFAKDDIGSDKQFMVIFLYIIMTIIAFIFAILTSNNIVKESNVIGTLRASGYTKKELVVHYLAMPIMVTLLAAIIGNVLGYTVFKDAASSIFYETFSLPTFQTVWNAEAFLKTTVIPLFIIFLINLIVLVDKLRLSPLRFIRRDLNRNKKKKALRLNSKLGIITRFRIRVIFQNIPNYITIFVGMFLANAILLFGSGLIPIMDQYQNAIVDNMICDYQYVLKMPVETDCEGVEKYSSMNLKTVSEKLKVEDVSVFGVIENSEFIPIDFSKGVYISNAYAEKFKLKVGDTFSMYDSYEKKDYEFKIGGIYDYPAAIAVFMDKEQFDEVFNIEEGRFTGYFSNQIITDIDEAFIATRITEDALTKTSRQMNATFKDMTGMVQAFGIIVFMLVVYLLSKVIIDKNAQSISMVKILGYTNKEVNGLYIASTAIVVVASLLLTIPLANWIMAVVIPIAMANYSGYLFYYIPFSVFVKMAAMGICGYAVIAFFQMRKVKKVPLDTALKNVE